MIDCIYLGDPTGRLVMVCCPQTGAAEQIFSPTFRCLHPDRARPRGKAGLCLPQWRGPWKLPQQSAEARSFAVCARCGLRVS